MGVVPVVVTKGDDWANWEDGVRVGDCDFVSRRVGYGDRSFGSQVERVGQGKPVELLHSAEMIFTKDDYVTPKDDGDIYY